ncbi:MAG: hypothetical protein JWN76_12 [Chitinophagaceae bacterium]|nr:hypothetical protein [Chitinophagaceae bacterium]
MFKHYSNYYDDKCQNEGCYYRISFSYNKVGGSDHLMEPANVISGMPSFINDYKKYIPAFLLTNDVYYSTIRDNTVGYQHK